jgi:hypothetical protein
LALVGVVGLPETCACATAGIAARTNRLNTRARIAHAMVERDRPPGCSYSVAPMS